MIFNTPQRHRHSKLTNETVNRAKTMGIMQNKNTVSPLKKKSTDWHALRTPKKAPKKEFWR